MSVCHILVGQQILESLRAREMLIGAKTLYGHPHFLVDSCSEVPVLGLDPGSAVMRSETLDLYVFSTDFEIGHRV